MFGKGNIFGTIDLDLKSEEGKFPKRIFTAQCKTLKGLVYIINKNAFFSKIKPYCESTLQKKQLKLSKFIPGDVIKASLDMTTKMNESFSNSKFTRYSKNNSFDRKRRTKSILPNLK